MNSAEPAREGFEYTTNLEYVSSRGLDNADKEV